MRPNSHHVQVVYPNVFANPAAVANGQMPRVFDVNTRLDHHLLAHFRPKKAQEEALQCARERPSSPEKYEADDVPQAALDHGSWMIILWLVGV